MENKSILLVEDNPDDIFLTRRAIKKQNLGCALVVVNDGIEALDYLYGTGKYADRDLNSMPALILLDLKLPLIDGLEVLQRIRADRRTSILPVVILTSSREENDLVRGYQLGANSYVRKPVDYDQFTETICQLKSYWLFLNEQPPVQRTD